MSNKEIKLGDSHNSNQAVSLRYTKSGEPVIVKPRNCKTEKAFKTFLDGLKQLGIPYIPKTVEILRESENSHEQSYVHHLCAKSQDEVTSYFYKCGVLLFSAYLLCSYDLHCENLIASSDSPVLIDLETLLSTEPVQRTARSQAVTLKNTVLKSHLLPNWIAVDDKICDCSGFTGVLHSDKNILFYNNVPVMAYDHIDIIIDGFKQAYKLTLENTQFMDELIDVFSECEFRQLLRPTDVYDKIINFLSLIDDSKKREEYAYTLLSKAYLRDIDPQRINKTKKIFDIEVDAVLNREIPLFNTYGNSRALYAYSGKLTEDFYEVSPIENAKNKLYSLSKEDLASQIKIIRQALNCAKPVPSESSLRKQDNDYLIGISDFLEEYSIPSLTSKWMLLDFGKDNSLFLQSAGMGIYNGLTGILCFYAAAYRKTGNSKFIDSLMHYYSSYRDFIINDERQIPLLDNTCSFSEGIAGQLLTLNHIYELTGEKIFYNDLLAVLNRVSFDNISIKNMEIMSGAIALSLLLPKVNSPTSKKIAQELKPHIKGANSSLTGVAHGTAGIALSMSALDFVLGENNFDEEILKLLEFENFHLDKSVNNWLDLRYKDRKGFMKGWCSGAPGIAMSRNKILKYTKNEKITEICKKDIYHAKLFLSTAEEQKKDSLCCGNSSLLVAGSCLGVSNDNLFKSLASRLNNGQINIYRPLDTCSINCGLMQGISGIGYALAMYGDPLCGDMLV